ncbi:MAG: hypothetical protein LCH87_02805 [Actinobacteria bacterium]|nr:hypothetical protein [Actinomycetota bacterium]
MNSPIIAWVDESGSNATHDPDTYIMAAAITTAGQYDSVRDTMTRLLLPGQVKLHWRDERATRQHRITDTIATIDIEHLVVVTSPHPSDRLPERRRRLTMEILLPELASLGVDRVIVESRGVKDDQRDRKMLDYLRQQSTINTALRIDHRVGRREPLLWLPDSLCGIVSAYRCGDPSLYDKIAHKVTLTQLPPRT